MISGRHVRRHLEFLQTLNDAKAASLRFLKDNAYTQGIHQEKT